MEALRSFQKLHFIGIGGVGMSAIASAMLSRGYQVTGSDMARGAITDRLTAQGAKIQFGHRADNVNGAQLVVTSSAIRPENPELAQAISQGLPVWRRARVLSELMKTGRSIAVSGTHGKTTTTSMVGMMLAEAGMDPTVLVGGDVDAFGGNARLGKGEWVVAEADESDASFLDMEPDRIIVTNIEADHLDYYRDLDHVIQTFMEFFCRMRPSGRIIACADSQPVLDVLREGCFPALTYSLNNPNADLVADKVRYSVEEGGTRFVPVLRGEPLDPVLLKVPGLQNVSNALAAILTGLNLGLTMKPIVRGLAAFAGAKRRFQVKGAAQGITVIDDYAHHPTELKATLAAARSTLGEEKGRRIIGVFQPHRYTRTESLAEEFGAAFGDADMIIITDVYSAGEKSIPGVNGGLIHKHALAFGHRSAHYIPMMADAAEFLKSRMHPGDMLLTLGAGDIHKLGDKVLDDLRPRKGIILPPAPDIDTQSDVDAELHAQTMVAG